MNRKPMLAVDCGGIDHVVFPVVASPKLDGVRAIVAESGLLSRTLKPIPNVQVQQLLAGLPVGLDGELIVGDPTAPDCYRKTVSVVMSDDADASDVRFYVFDNQPSSPVPFESRLEYLDEFFQGCRAALVQVPQLWVHTASDLAAYEELNVKAGYEGLILRAPNSPYKHGRSTVREGYLLKLKRFVDSEAEVIGVTELMHNANTATVNELGRTARSSHKAGKVGRGVLGALKVRDVKTGVEFEIGTGFTAAERAELWREYVAQYEDWPRPLDPFVPAFPLAKYKHFEVGAKDKPRFPVFLGWRDRRDV